MVNLSELQVQYLLIWKLKCSSIHGRRESWYNGTWINYCAPLNYYNTQLRHLVVRDSALFSDRTRTRLYVTTCRTTKRDGSGYPKVYIQVDTILSSQLGYLRSFVVQLSCMYILNANPYVHLEIALIKS